MPHSPFHPFTPSSLHPFNLQPGKCLFLYWNNSSSQQFIMFDNFLEEEYHPSDSVFTHPRTSNQIYIGDVQSALDRDALLEKNITTVVTAAKDMDHVRFDSKILHIVYPLLDGKNEDITAFFDTFYNMVETNIQRGSILVHCAAGISRSSTLVISYLMKFSKQGFKESIAEVRKYRPSVLPNLGFERQLKRYEEIVRRIKTQKIVRRTEDKKNGSGHQISMKTQIIPNFQGLVRPKKTKMLSGNVVNFFDNVLQKDSQILKVYNNNPRNELKHNKFVITKKAASFSKHLERKNLMMINTIRDKQDNEAPCKGSRQVNSSLEEMKAIYLLRKGQLNRHNTTERNGTFYNIKMKKMEL